MGAPPRHLSKLGGSSRLLSMLTRATRSVFYGFLNARRCRCHSRNYSLTPAGQPHDLLFLPQFFSESEQRVLLSVALQKLDSRESRLFKRRRKDYQARLGTAHMPTTIESHFLPDEFYDFEEVAINIGHDTLSGPV